MVRYIEKCLLCLLLTACSQDPKTVKKISKDIVPATPVSQAKPRPDYEAVLNGIEIKYRLRKEVAFLAKLDSIACLSDADLSEMVSVTTVAMYSIDNALFFKLIYTNKLHCVERAFINGMSEELSVLGKTERLTSLSQLRSAIIKSSSTLSIQERRNAEALINQIKPDIFD